MLFVVNMHWGDEYSLKPNSNQKRSLLIFLFENGVDLIFRKSYTLFFRTNGKGLLLWKMVQQKDGFIIYSLGNFMSGQKT